MYNDKFVQSLLKKLLQYGAKAIKKRSSQKKNDDKPDEMLERQLIGVFSSLLGENYDVKTFKRQIIEKRLQSKPSAKKVEQMLYNFIYVIELDGKEIDTDQVTAMSRDIVEIINKLNITSRFFEFKRHLITKVLQLTKIKKLYSSTPPKIDISKIRDGVKKYLDEFKENNVLNFKSAIQVLEFLNKNTPHILSISMSDNDYQLLESFFKNFSIKCQNFIEREEYTKNPEQVNVGIKGIISEINILLNQIDSIAGIPSSNECLELCRKIRYLSKSSAQKFDYNEKNRENEAYSLESFKKILFLHQDAISRANELLKRNGFDEIIPDNTLSEYEELISDKSGKILNKKIYDQKVEKMRSDVKKSMDKVASESIFGKSVPTSNKVLDKIVDLFNKLGR